MASDPTETTDAEFGHVAEFRERMDTLLNFPWPPRGLADLITANKARALAAQLRNWESWK